MEWQIAHSLNLARSLASPSAVAIVSHPPLRSPPLSALSHSLRHIRQSRFLAPPTQTSRSEQTVGAVIERGEGRESDTELLFTPRKVNRQVSQSDSPFIYYLMNQRWQIPAPFFSADTWPTFQTTNSQVLFPGNCQTPIFHSLTSR